MDKNYCENLSQTQEAKHLYPSNVHLVGNAYTNSLLSFIGSPEIKQPLLNTYFEWAYIYLLQESMNRTFPMAKQSVPTRMQAHHPKEGIFTFQGLDNESTHVVAVDIARAGSWPSHVIYQHLNYFFHPENVRQDHIYINRRTDADGQVIGQTLTGSKIGGPVENSLLVLPDPMGATGGTIASVLKHYKESVKGSPKKIIALHLIITPEYINRMKEDFPNVEIFCLRIDRGLSSAKALESLPGKFPEEEKGLNEFQYILPGAGGVGEVLNNSFV
jgi:uracil phosphoribosyltransferase